MERDERFIRGLDRNLFPGKQLALLCDLGKLLHDYEGDGSIAGSEISFFNLSGTENKRVVWNGERFLISSTGE